ncbi:uncharacterized protein LOC132268337 [Cornus florida]|uniref:uncharacterized protein LOC132268337 n=1 Tax=Cornus florida TaxID=4283 RepID=UPI002899CBEF|nr:uncharacterized protein LOC132268337 [Cornus florida]
MAVSVESPSPVNLNKESNSFMSSSPMFSPSSDKRFWSTLRGRIETLLDNRKPIYQSSSTQTNAGEFDRAKRMKEDSLLLLRGFDSVAYSLSQLSSNLDNALQGARDLARPPTLTEMFHSAMEKAKNKEDESEEAAEEKGEEDEEEAKRGLKRKFATQECCVEKEDDDSHKDNEKKLNKAKNLAISMASNAASFARELKLIKSDLCFVQERCALLEEENRRLRDGFAKGIRPEEDDLVRLQLEALLAEKSRLANENANLTRENQCLHQLVEYHQLTSQDLSETYEHIIRGTCLDFSSPPPSIPEEDGDEVLTKTPKGGERFGLSTSLNEFYCQEQ